MLIIYLLLFPNSNKRLTHRVYDSSYNEVHSCPYSYINVNPSLVIPDYNRIDGKIDAVIDSLSNTNITKIGKGHSAIITIPKPMSAEKR